jgi:hypothetical protein
LAAALICKGVAFALSITGHGQPLGQITRLPRTHCPGPVFRSIVVTVVTLRLNHGAADLGSVRNLLLRMRGGC